MSIFKLNLKLYFSILLLISNTALIWTMEDEKEVTTFGKFAEIMARADTPTALEAIDLVGGVPHLNDHGATSLEQVLKRFDKKPSSTILDRLYDNGLRAKHLLQLNYTTGWACTIYTPISSSVSNPEAMARIRAKFGITPDTLPLSRAELTTRASVVIDIYNANASTVDRK